VCICPSQILWRRRQQLPRTGTSHIIAISGFNISIIAGILAGLTERLFGRRRAMWVAVAGVGFYTILVGAAASVVRAALMGILYL